MKFYKGMRRDTAHVDQPQDSYRRARNIILDHTTFSVRTEGSLAGITSTDADPDLTIGRPGINRSLCGIIDLPQDRQLAIFQNITTSTNELFLIQDNEYSRVFVSSDYGWNPDLPIKGVAYENSQEDTIVVWTDGQNPPVYTNLNAATIQVYNLFPEAQFPNVIPIEQAGLTGGEIENGTYSFFIAYEVDEDNITTFSPSYGTFNIGHGINNKTVDTKIGLRFENLDTNYAYYRIYAIRNRNETLDTLYVGRQPTVQSDFIWAGNTKTGDLTIEQLTVPKGWYNTVETLSVLDDRLYMANVSRTDSFDGQAIANNLQLVWSVDSRLKTTTSPIFDEVKRKQWGPQYNNFLVNELDNKIVPANRDHYGMSKGFMPGCSYAFYVAFLLKDGTWTQAYHIPAGTSNSAATVITPPQTGFPTLGSNEYHGVLGSKSNGNGSYVHVMPDPSLVHDAVDTVDYTANAVGASRDLAKVWAVGDIGVSATSIDSNPIIPESVRDFIQGYSLFYAKPNGNSRDVLGYIPYQETRGYIDQTDTIDGDYSTPYIGVYDPYLLNQKPELNNFSYTVVYDGKNTADPWNLSSVSSPDTSITHSLFEYLPGNSIGLEFNNNNRENKLCIKRVDLAGNSLVGNITGRTGEVRGTGDEGSQLLFGTNAPSNFEAYLDEASAFVYLKIHKEASLPSDYYVELDNQELCACSYIEQDLNSSSMKRVSWGGDAVCHPVRYRYIQSYSSLPADEDAVGEENHGPVATTVTHSLVVKTSSYFTWSYALQGYEDLTDPTILTEQQILVYETDPNLFYAGSPYIMNPSAIPTHTYAKNDLKSAFTTSLEDPVTNFPNRIIRSAKQNYESNSIRWRNFAIADYYDNAFNKGPIQNIESYGGELIIHHTDGIFKTTGKETLDTSAAAVFVGSGDIFRAAPQELISTEEGYAGLTKHTDSKLTKGGYIFVDSAVGKVFKLDSNLADISQKGMKTYFRESFRVDSTVTHSPFSGNGYAIGYDPVFDRILISCVTALNESYEVTEFKTISYSLLSDCWASNHTYPALGFATNRNGLILFSGAKFLNTNIGVNTAGAYIEPVFNDGGTIVKQFQSFQWMTRVGEGEGDWQQQTFDSAIVYNDRGCSGLRTLTDNSRWVEESWNFNDFRNLVDDANQGTAFFDDDEELIVEINTNKPWYQQQRIRGGYAAIRLIISADRDITLYLTEAVAKFRASYR